MELTKGDGMKNYTTERRAFNAEVADPRALWLMRQPICWWCVYPAQGVHEIGAAGLRRQMLDEPCCWAAACNRCNQNVVTDYSVWPVVRQLAVKLRWNPEDYNLARYNEVRRRGPDAITQGQVLLALKTMLALEEV
jgi:hypothetical protein